MVVVRKTHQWFVQSHRQKYKGGLIEAKFINYIEMAKQLRKLRVKWTVSVTNNHRANGKCSFIIDVHLHVQLYPKVWRLWFKKAHDFFKHFLKNNCLLLRGQLTHQSICLVSCNPVFSLNPARAEDLHRPHQVHFLCDNKFLEELFWTNKKRT